MNSEKMALLAKIFFPEVGHIRYEKSLSLFKLFIAFKKYFTLQYLYIITVRFSVYVGTAFP